ncbi:hypothetical protein C0995_001473 [Termitomyces sp. Mi166|nr:hypothetical protein C0995_001473 [Termitomyces sp. Mi166\
MCDPPSHRRKYVGYINKDTRLQEAQNIALKLRHKLTKRATQAAQSIISSLQATIQQHDAAIRGAQAQLAELSILESEIQQKNEPLNYTYISATFDTFLTNLANSRISLVENCQSDLSRLPVQPQKEIVTELTTLFRALEPYRVMSD